jgi:hypothetical protein
MALSWLARLVYNRFPFLSIRKVVLGIGLIAIIEI